MAHTRTILVATLGLTLLIGTAATATAQTPAAAAPVAAREAAVATDVATIDGIIAALYDVISGPAGKTRDWDRFRSLFSEGGRLLPTAVRPDGTRVFRNWTVEDYIQSAGPGLERNGFYEREISRTMDQFGQVAHVFSTYDSRRVLDEAQPFARGINSIQLRHDGTRWWIVTVFWDSERADNPIPAKYLGGGPGDA